MPEIHSRRDGSILVLTMDNEAKRNAFTHGMTLRLGEILEEAEVDKSVRCIVITGSGNRAFSSGHDLNELLTHRDHAADESLNEPFFKPQRMTTPTIAVVNGVAHAGGFILALSCDMRICEPHADFAAPGARIGLLPIGGQISRLPSLVPLGIAYEILATARRVTAEEAVRFGFVNRVAEPGRAKLVGLEVARLIAANSRNVVAGIKTGLDIFAREGSEAARRFESSEGRRLQSQPDADEGMKAFLEKRPPCFQ
jgi:enoyl-CoA hydratase/carnithine racemase